MLTGELTVKGITRPVDLQVEFGGARRDPYGQDIFGFSATAEIDREDYGLVWNVALESGGVLVGKTVRIAIAGEAAAACRRGLRARGRHPGAGPVVRRSRGGRPGRGRRRRPGARRPRRCRQRTDGNGPWPRTCPPVSVLRMATFAPSFHWMVRHPVATTIRGMLQHGGAFVHMSDARTRCRRPTFRSRRRRTRPPAIGYAATGPGTPGRSGRAAARDLRRRGGRAEPGGFAAPLLLRVPAGADWSGRWTTWSPRTARSSLQATFR